MTNRDIVNYIDQCRGQGISDDIIRGELVKVGWQEGDINDSFVAVSIGSEKEKPKSKARTWITLVFIFLAVIAGSAGAGYYYFFAKKNTEQSSSGRISSNIDIQKTTELCQKKLDKYFETIASFADMTNLSEIEKTDKIEQLKKENDMYAVGGMVINLPDNTGYSDYRIFPFPNSETNDDFMILYYNQGIIEADGYFCLPVSKKANRVTLMIYPCSGLVESELGGGCQNNSSEKADFVGGSHEIQSLNANIYNVIVDFKSLIIWPNRGI